MIVTITQTYGDNRTELYDLRSKDYLLKYFIDSFDHHIFSFHNCSIDTINYFKNLNTCKEYMEFNNIDYTETLRTIIEKLKQMKCTKLIFLQDDVFSFNQNKEDIDSIISEIKNNKVPLLNLEKKFTDFTTSVQEKMFTERKINNIEIIKSFTSFFSESGFYSFDDGPYVLDFDFIDIIYDNNFFNQCDVWNAELYNNQKFKYYNFPRYITNMTLFKRYNIVGRNILEREDELKEIQGKLSNKL